MFDSSSSSFSGTLSVSDIASFPEVALETPQRRVTFCESVTEEDVVEVSDNELKRLLNDDSACLNEVEATPKVFVSSPRVTGVSPPYSFDSMPRFVQKEHSRSRSLIAKTPVNEEGAIQERAKTLRHTTELLTVYRKVKHNTLQLLRRRYYDKWLSLLEPQRRVNEFGTQTQYPWNERRETVKVLEHDALEFSLPRRSRDPSVEEENTSFIQRPKAVKPVANDQQNGNDADTLQAREVQFSKPTPFPDGIAAVSRPAKSLSRVKKSDLPSRKTLHHSGLVDTQLPSVVEHPIRVEYAAERTT